jgi:hypothetical protein
MSGVGLDSYRSSCYVPRVPSSRALLTWSPRSPRELADLADRPTFSPRSAKSGGPR